MSKSVGARRLSSFVIVVGSRRFTGVARRLQTATRRIVWMMYRRLMLPVLVAAIGIHASVSTAAPPTPAASAPTDAASAAVAAPEMPASAPISYSARRVYEQARSQLV